MFINTFNDELRQKITKKNLLSYLIGLMLIIAFITIARGSYMVLKAHVAQYLLAQAWQTHSTNDKNHISQKDKGTKVKPWSWADFYPVAKLRFDGMDITQIVLSNDSGQALAFGPGLNQSLSADIDSNKEVVVISAHKDTHFSILKDLKLKDHITLTLKSGLKQTFTVNNMSVIDLETEQLVITRQNTIEGRKDEKNQNNKLIKELVLVTCYPFYGVGNDTKLRYVVYLT
ncbi:sortase [Colwellia sp. MSW7]|uniref:Sortase n=1 Tax=Colwellia maritima TaxID=2912588 RepID=A0ABS9X1P1_9GAMM|nr:sortase [Colwellia maritima]MCI2284166.1 sortase [Colwellia maritima]